MFFLFFLELFDQYNWKEKECNNKMRAEGEVWVTYTLHGFCRDLIISVNPEIHKVKTVSFTCILLQK